MVAMLKGKHLKPAGGRKSSAVLSFTKMQALGNDFVVVDQDELEVVLSALELLHGKRLQPPQLARQLCRLHFGIGADGFIVAIRGRQGEIAWQYLNSDGSSSLMCGNGLRCLALWCVRAGWAPGRAFTITTARGPVAIEFESEDAISTDLGEPALEGRFIPVSGPVVDQARVVRHKIRVLNRELSVTCLSMGNPHCVVFEPEARENEYAALAEALQADELFPEGANIEFVWVQSRESVAVKVWERGCGATLACASGAAAVLVAGVLEGRLERQAVVSLPGGDLKVTWRADGHVVITGPARVSFQGSIDLFDLFLPEPDR